MVGKNESRITKKGQIVIPADIRHRYGITPGVRIQFLEKEGQILLNPLTPQLFRQKLEKLRGIVRGGVPLTKELEAERSRDREREERDIESWPGPR